MGYCSDVCIVTKKSTYEDFMIAYSKKFNDVPDSYEVHTLDPDEKYVRIDWYDVKWYSYLEEVVFIETYFNTYSDYFEFLRIGELYDDVEYNNLVPTTEEYRLYCKRSAEVII